MRASAASVAPTTKVPVTRVVSGLKPPFPVALQRGLKRKGWEPRTLATIIRKTFGSVPGSTEEEILQMINGDLKPEGKVWPFMRSCIPELWGTRMPRGVQEQTEQDGSLEAMRQCEERAAHETAELERDRQVHDGQGWSTRRPPPDWGTALWVFRVAAGISAQQLAEFCDVDVRAVVEGWQSNKNPPAPDAVRAIHDLLPGLRSAVEEGLVEKPPAPSTTRPMVRPSKAAALELVVPLRRTEPPAAPPAEPVVAAVVAAPAPVAIPEPPTKTEDALLRVMREHFSAMAAEAAAKTKLAAAKQLVDDAQKAFAEAEFAHALAEENRKKACDELEKFAAASAG